MTCNLPTRSVALADRSPLKDIPLYIQVFDSIQQAEPEWVLAAPPDNRFLSVPYLKVLEAAPPVGFNFRYVVFFRQDIPVGVAYFQFFTFRGCECVRPDPLPPSPSWGQRWSNRFKQAIVDRLRFYPLLCGNALLTGEHGFYFKEEIVPAAGQLQVLNETFTVLAQQLRSEGHRVEALALKDFGEPARMSVFAGQRTFAEFSFLPSMEMDLDPAWKSYEDYLEALTSKYRVRIRRAAKKAAPLGLRPLTVVEIAAFSERIHALYREIAQKATVNLVRLNPGYFLELKRTFGEAFQLMGYWKEDELVGFFTTLENGDQLEAHFLGFDQEINATTQLYLNMLLEMIRIAIESGCKSIHFARTAMEIKSSVGAVGHPMYNYVRHRRTWLNQLIIPLLRRLTPQQEVWTPRHPFKTEESF